MFTIAKLPLWQDFGFGLLLMVLVTVAAERLGRYIEADAVQRRLSARATPIRSPRLTFLNAAPVPRVVRLKRRV